MSNITDKVKNLPQAPGVYFFYGTDKELLYIGKATNLRSRVGSYFRGEHNRGEWIDRMISLIANIAFQETDSVLEALILESNLIKKHQPKYNTLEKDDKSFSYFAITKEEFPRVLILRKTDLERSHQPACRTGRSLVISNQKIADKIELKVKSKKIQNTKANKLMPEKLQAIYGPYTSKFQMQIALKIMRRIFPFHAHKQKSEKGCLDFQLGVCPGPYANAISQEDYKKNIRGIRMILEGKKVSLLKTLTKEMESASKKHEFEKAGEIKNKIYALNHIRDVALMTREFDNFEFRISNFESNPNEKNSKIETLEIQSKFKIQNSKFFRIEAYDISNISGDHAVGSMVVFENGQPNKSQYRKFKIKTVVGSNDVGMMREVLLRRFKNDWPMPDLVLLDGGAGHLNMAEKLLYEELGLSLNIASVAKGPTRKKLDIRISSIRNTSASWRNEIQDTSNLELENENNKIINILQDDLLIKAIMDEAHRFAITYHRKVRRKNSLL